MAHYITDANKKRIKVAGNYGIKPKRYAVETYKNATTEYTIYNEGWKECSGFATRSGNYTPLALPITFSDTNYKIFLTAQTRLTDVIAVTYEDKTTNSFIPRMDSWKGEFNYYCCGY